MAVGYACDGCDFTTKVSAELCEMGRILPKHYCSACADAVEEFQKRAGVIHREAIESLDKAMDELKKEFGDRLDELPLVGDV